METTIEKMMRYGKIPETLFTTTETQMKDKQTYQETLQKIRDQMKINREELRIAQ